AIPLRTVRVCEGKVVFHVDPENPNTNLWNQRNKYRAWAGAGENKFEKATQARMVQKRIKQNQGQCLPDHMAEVSRWPTKLAKIYYRRAFLKHVEIIVGADGQVYWQMKGALRFLERRGYNLLSYLGQKGERNYCVRLKTGFIIIEQKEAWLYHSRVVLQELISTPTEPEPLESQDIDTIGNNLAIGKITDDPGQIQDSPISIRGLPAKIRLRQRGYVDTEDGIVYVGLPSEYPNLREAFSQVEGDVRRVLDLDDVSSADLVQSLFAPVRGIVVRNQLFKPNVYSPVAQFNTFNWGIEVDERLEHTNRDFISFNLAHEIFEAILSINDLPRTLRELYARYLSLLLFLNSPASYQANILVALEDEVFFYRGKSPYAEHLNKVRRRCSNLAPEDEGKTDQILLQEAEKQMRTQDKFRIMPHHTGWLSSEQASHLGLSVRTKCLEVLSQYSTLQDGPCFVPRGVDLTYEADLRRRSDEIEKVTADLGKAGDFLLLCEIFKSGDISLAFEEVLDMFGHLSAGLRSKVQEFFYTNQTSTVVVLPGDVSLQWRMFYQDTLGLFISEFVWEEYKNKRAFLAELISFILQEMLRAEYRLSSTEVDACVESIEEFSTLAITLEGRASSREKLTSLEDTLLKELDTLEVVVQRMAKKSGCKASGVRETIQALRGDLTTETVSEFKKRFKDFSAEAKAKAVKEVKKDPYKLVLKAAKDKKSRLTKTVGVMLGFIEKWGAVFSHHHVRSPDRVFFVEERVVKFVLEALEHYTQPDRDKFFKDFYLDEVMAVWEENAPKGVKISDKRRQMQRAAFEQNVPENVIEIVLQQALLDMPDIIYDEVIKTVASEFSGWILKLPAARPSNRSVEHNTSRCLKVFVEVFTEVMAEVGRPFSIDRHEKRKLVLTESVSPAEFARLVKAVTGDSGLTDDFLRLGKAIAVGWYGNRPQPTVSSQTLPMSVRWGKGESETDMTPRTQRTFIVTIDKNGKSPVSVAGKKSQAGYGGVETIFSLGARHHEKEIQKLTKPLIINVTINGTQTQPAITTVTNSTISVSIHPKAIARINFVGKKQLQEIIGFDELGHIFSPKDKNKVHQRLVAFLRHTPRISQPLIELVSANRGFAFTNELAEAAEMLQSPQGAAVQATAIIETAFKDIENSTLGNDDYRRVILENLEQALNAAKEGCIAEAYACLKEASQLFPYSKDFGGPEHSITVAGRTLKKAKKFVEKLLGTKGADEEEMLLDMERQAFKDDTPSGSPFPVLTLVIFVALTGSLVFLNGCASKVTKETGINKEPKDYLMAAGLFIAAAMLIWLRMHILRNRGQKKANTVSALSRNLSISREVAEKVFKAGQKYQSRYRHLVRLIYLGIVASLISGFVYAHYGSFPAAAAALGEFYERALKAWETWQWWQSTPFSSIGSDVPGGFALAVAPLWGLSDAEIRKVLAEAARKAEATGLKTSSKSSSGSVLSGVLASIIAGEVLIFTWAVAGIYLVLIVIGISMMFWMVKGVGEKEGVRVSFRMHAGRYIGKAKTNYFENVSYQTLLTRLINTSLQKGIETGFSFDQEGNPGTFAKGRKKSINPRKYRITDRTYGIVHWHPLSEKFKKRILPSPGDINLAEKHGQRVAAVVWGDKRSGFYMVEIDLLNLDQYGYKPTVKYIQIYYTYKKECTTNDVLDILQYLELSGAVTAYRLKKDGDKYISQKIDIKELPDAAEKIYRIQKNSNKKLFQRLFIFIKKVSAFNNKISKGKLVSKIIKKIFFLGNLKRYNDIKGQVQEGSTSSVPARRSADIQRLASPLPWLVGGLPQDSAFRHAGVAGGVPSPALFSTIPHKNFINPQREINLAFGEGIRFRHKMVDNLIAAFKKTIVKRGSHYSPRPHEVSLDFDERNAVKIRRALTHLKGLGGKHAERALRFEEETTVIQVHIPAALLLSGKVKNDIFYQLTHVGLTRKVIYISKYALDKLQDEKGILELATVINHDQQELEFIHLPENQDLAKTPVGLEALIKQAHEYADQDDPFSVQDDLKAHIREGVVKNPVTEQIISKSIEKLAVAIKAKQNSLRKATITPVEFSYLGNLFITLGNLYSALGKRRQALAAYHAGRDYFAMVQLEDRGGLLPLYTQFRIVALLAEEGEYERAKEEYSNLLKGYISRALNIEEYGIFSFYMGNIRRFFGEVSHLLYRYAQDTGRVENEKCVLEVIQYMQDETNAFLAHKDKIFELLAPPGNVQIDPENVKESYERIANEAREFIHKHKAVFKEHKLPITCEGHAYEVKRRLHKLGVKSWAYHKRTLRKYRVWVVTEDGYIIDVYPESGGPVYITEKINDSEGKYKGVKISEWGNTLKIIVSWFRLAAELEMFTDSESASCPAADSQARRVLGWWKYRHLLKQEFGYAGLGNLFKEDAGTIVVKILYAAGRLFGIAKQAPPKNLGWFDISSPSAEHPALKLLCRKNRYSVGIHEKVHDILGDYEFPAYRAECMFFADLERLIDLPVEEVAGDIAGKVRIKDESFRVRQQAPLQLTGYEKDIITRGWDRRSDGEDNICLFNFPSWFSARRLFNLFGRKIYGRLGVQNKDILVLPATGFNLIAELIRAGARSVTVADYDPVTIAWLKAFIMYGNSCYLKKFLLGEGFTLEDSEAVRVFLRDSVREGDTPQPLERVYFKQVDVIDGFPETMRDSFDLVFVAWIFGASKGVRGKGKVARSFRNLIDATRTRGRIAILPVKPTWFAPVIGPPVDLSAKDTLEPVEYAALSYGSKGIIKYWYMYDSHFYCRASVFEVGSRRNFLKAPPGLESAKSADSDLSANGPQLITLDDRDALIRLMHQEGACYYRLFVKGRIDKTSFDSKLNRPRRIKINDTAFGEEDILLIQNALKLVWATFQQQGYRYKKLAEHINRLYVYAITEIPKNRGVRINKKGHLCFKVHSLAQRRGKKKIVNSVSVIRRGSQAVFALSYLQFLREKYADFDWENWKRYPNKRAVALKLACEIAHEWASSYESLTGYISYNTERGKTEGECQHMAGLKVEKTIVAYAWNKEFISLEWVEYFYSEINLEIEASESRFKFGISRKRDLQSREFSYFDRKFEGKLPAWQDILKGDVSWKREKQFLNQVNSCIRQLYIGNSYRRRMAARWLSWMQEDGLEILKKALFSKKTSLATKISAGYGLRLMCHYGEWHGKRLRPRGRMKDKAFEVLQNGLKNKNPDVVQASLHSLRLIRGRDGEREAMRILNEDAGNNIQKNNKTSGSGGSIIDLSRIPHHHLPSMFPNSIDYMHQAGYLGAKGMFGNSFWGNDLNLRFADSSIPEKIGNLSKDKILRKNFENKAKVYGGKGAWLRMLERLSKKIKFNVVSPTSYITIQQVWSKFIKDNQKIVNQGNRLKQENPKVNGKLSKPVYEQLQRLRMSFTFSKDLIDFINSKIKDLEGIIIVRSSGSNEDS
ncbi:MAG: hypothetical protein ISS43_04215, partial [Candidatus Omnitrophica bacterium]|nr:hypothetical protein [Candidatus Omnitrophota bacterium]